MSRWIIQVACATSYGKMFRITDCRKMCCYFTEQVGCERSRGLCSQIVRCSFGSAVARWGLSAKV